MPPKPPARPALKSPGGAVARPAAGSPKPKGPGTGTATPARPGTTPRPTTAPSRPSVKFPPASSAKPSAVGRKKSVIGKTTNSSKGIPGPNAGLQPLVQTKNIFIKKTSISLEAFALGPSKYTAYEILSTKEDRILFAVDSTEVSPLAKVCPCLAPQTFMIKILSSTGTEVLSIAGSLGKGAKAEVKSDEENFGYVKLDDGTESTYSALNSKGDNIFTIKKSDDPKLTHDFAIFSPNGKNKLGKVSRSWEASQQRYPEWFSKIDIFGLSFPKDQNLKTKTLLIGAGILLFFQNFGGR